MVNKITSLAQYCLDNSNRVFHGTSFGHLLITYDRDVHSSTNPVYRDRLGIITTKTEVAKALGVSIKTAATIFARFNFDHARVFTEYPDKRTPINIFRLDNGDITTSSFLGALYGVHPSSVSRVYSKFKGDHVLANNQLMERKCLQRLSQ
jgi:hypothetical protein